VHIFTLDALEPDPSGHYLEIDIAQGLRHIAQLTGSQTYATNSILNQVTDIVSLPHLDDRVHAGIRDSTIKRDDTVTQLHEFDANQTMALTPIAENFLMMKTWISDIESMFRERLTDVHFESNQWAALSSKNTLKTELVQHTAEVAGLSIMTAVDGQPTTMLSALLAGENPLTFGYGFMENRVRFIGQVFQRFLAWRRMEDHLMGRAIRLWEVMGYIMKTSAPFSLLPYFQPF